MKWFDKWFLAKCRWAWDQPRPLKKHADLDILIKEAPEESTNWGDGLHIMVKKVIGGFVVTFRTHDRLRDRMESRHYIITEEQDFDRELGKLITMESMRQ